MKNNGAVSRLPKNNKTLNALFGETAPRTYAAVYFLQGGLAKQAEIYEKRIKFAQEKYQIVIGVADSSGFPDIQINSSSYQPMPSHEARPWTAPSKVVRSFDFTYISSSTSTLASTLTSGPKVKLLLRSRRGPKPKPRFKLSEGKGQETVTAVPPLTTSQQSQSITTVATVSPEKSQNIITKGSSPSSKVSLRVSPAGPLESEGPRRSSRIRRSAPKRAESLASVGPDKNQLRTSKSKGNARNSHIWDCICGVFGPEDSKIPLQHPSKSTFGVQCDDCYSWSHNTCIGKHIKRNSKAHFSCHRCNNQTLVKRESNPTSNTIAHLVGDINVPLENGRASSNDEEGGSEHSSQILTDIDSSHRRSQSPDVEASFYEDDALDDAAIQALEAAAAAQEEAEAVGKLLAHPSCMPSVVSIFTTFLPLLTLILQSILQPAPYAERPLNNRLPLPKKSVSLDFYCMARQIYRCGRRTKSCAYLVSATSP